MTLGSSHAQICDDPIVDSLVDESYYLSSTFPDSAILIAHQALELAQKVNDVKGEITSYLRIGDAYSNRGESSNALKNFSLAEKCFSEKEVDSIFLAKIYLYQSPIYKMKGLYDIAFQKNLRAFEIAKSLHEKMMMGFALLNMSNDFKDRGEYEKAISVLHHAQQQFDPTDLKELGDVKINIGNIYELQGRHNEAITLNKQANVNFSKSNSNFESCKALLNIGNNFLAIEIMDSALFYFNKAGNLSNGRYKAIDGKVYHGKGTFFMRIGILDSAIFYLEKSLDLKQKNNDLEGLLVTMKNLGDLTYIKGDKPKAEEYLLVADTMANNLKDPLFIERVSKQLANIYRDNGDLELSNFYLDKSISYQDSISKNIRESLIYEIKYEEEKHKVDQLELSLKNEQLAKEKQKGIVLLIVAVAFGISIIFLLLLRNSRQKRRTAEIEKDGISKQKEINDLINEQEKQSMQAMFEGQEKEKDRMAIELHDKLGAILSTVKLYFKSIDKQILTLRESNIEKYYKANNLLDEACEETRKIAHHLSSNNVGRIGLFETVSIFQRKISDSDEIEFILTTHGSDEALDQLNQVSIYRIIQELVNNILKHAIAKEINLQLNVFDAQLFNLIIEDDGIGFEINELMDSTGMGLKEIESRVKTMNGTISIDSGKGAGTSITIDIPLKKEI